VAPAPAAHQVTPPALLLLLLPMPQGTAEVQPGLLLLQATGGNVQHHTALTHPAPPAHTPLQGRRDCATQLLHGWMEEPCSARATNPLLPTARKRPCFAACQRQPSPAAPTAAAAFVPPLRLASPDRVGRVTRV
jgi:hypothetical protein